MSTPISTRPRDAAGSTRGQVHAIHYHLSFLGRNLNDPAAPTVVLLHGFPGDATQFEPVLAGLGATQALAFDLLGFGKSDHPWPADVTVWGHADAIHLAIRALDLRQVILVGHGLGGGVAQILATRLMPERVTGLVLIASTAFQFAFNPNWPLPEMEKRQDPEAPRHTALADLEAALRQTLPQGSATGLSGAAIDTLVMPWLSEIGKECFFQQVRSLIPAYGNAIAGDLAHLHCPTLVIWGEKDLIIPLKWGQFLQRTIPNSALHVVPNAGHLILHDAPTAVTRLVMEIVGK